MTGRGLVEEPKAVSSRVEAGAHNGNRHPGPEVMEL